MKLLKWLATRLGYPDCQPPELKPRPGAPFPRPGTTPDEWWPGADQRRGGFVRCQGGQTLVGRVNYVDNARWQLSKGGHKGR